MKKPETKQQYLYNELIKYIKENNLQDGDKIPPERVLAEKYNTSRVTVRNVLMNLLHDGVLIRQQGRGTFVAPEKTKEADGANNHIHFIGHSFNESGNDAFSSGLINNLSKQLTSQGRSLNMNILPTESGLSDLISKGTFNPDLTSGVIFGTYAPTDQELKYLEENNIPCVIIGELPEDSQMQAPCLCSDFSTGTYEAVKLLAENGHSQIAICNGSLEYSFCRDIAAGFRKGLSASNINYDPVLLAETIGWRKENGYNAMKYLLGTNKEITAVISYGDMSTLGVIEALKEHNLEIGKDISFIQIDYYDWLDQLSPRPLTAVVNPLEEVAARAIDIISQPNSANAIYKIPTKVIQRKSVINIT